MIWVYYVSYYYVNEANPGFAFGFTEISLGQPITRLDNLICIANYISRREQQTKPVVILSYQLLRKDKITKEVNKVETVLKGLLDHLPDSEHEGSECWEWAFNMLDDDAQTSVKEHRKKANEWLKTINILK